MYLQVQQADGNYADKNNHDAKKLAKRNDRRVCLLASGNSAHVSLNRPSWISVCGSVSDRLKQALIVTQLRAQHPSP